MLCPMDTRYHLSLPQFNAFGLKILLAKESIVPVDPVKGQFVSSYFAVTKAHSPGKFRPILNLKKFNKSVKKYKFRMEGLKQVWD